MHMHIKGLEINVSNAKNTLWLEGVRLALLFLFLEIVLDIIFHNQPTNLTFSNIN